MGFVGRSSWRQEIAANVFAASREREAERQTGASLATTGVMGGISFFFSLQKSCFMLFAGVLRKTWVFIVSPAREWENGGSLSTDVNKHRTDRAK